MSKTILSVAVALTLCLPLSAARADETRDRLLERVRVGNAATITAIQTFRCTFSSTFVYHNGNKQRSADRPLEGTYWREGNVLRLRQTGARAEGLAAIETIHIGDKVSQLNQYAPSEKYPNGFQVYTIYQIDAKTADVWLLALFEHFGPRDIETRTYDQLTALSHTILGVAEVTEEGRKLIRVEAEYRGAQRVRHTFYFDPAVNYLIRKTVSEPAAGAMWTHTFEVEDFREVSPGVYFPSGTRRHWSDGKGGVYSTETVRFTDVEINRPLPTRALKLPLVAGVECADLVRNVKYPVDADGKRIGPEKSFKPEDPIFPPAADVVPLAQPALPPAPSWWASYWWVGAAVLGVIVSGVVVRTVRQRNT